MCVYLVQEHFYLETQVTVAVPKGEDGEMELFVSTQNPKLTQVPKVLNCLLIALSQDNCNVKAGWESVESKMRL